MQHPQSTDRANDGFVLLTETVSKPLAATEGPAPTIDAPAVGEGPEHLLMLDDLFTELEPIRPEQVVLVLAGSAAVRLAGRAAFLGLMDAERATELGCDRDWQALMEAGVSAAQMAMLIRAEPWLPPVNQGLPFCHWLVSQAVLGPEQLEALHERSVELGWPIFQVALEQGLLDEARYVAQLARFADLEIADEPGDIVRSVLVGFPMGWVEHFDLVPLERVGGGFVIAVARPLPGVLLDRMAADLGGPVECQLAAPAAVSAWRRRWLRHWWRIHHPGRSALSDV